jgi:pilus assembly protein Flp/PilA
MRVFFWTLINDKSGVTAIEYGLIAALIAVAAISIMGMPGTNLSGTFSKTGSKAVRFSKRTCPDARRLVMSVGP